MPKNNIDVAICYDFDGTLSPKNMQEYDFFNALGNGAKKFWAEARALAKENNADEILAYMMLMIERAKNSKAKTTRSAFRDYGKGIELYPGVDTWFDRINQYGKQLGLAIHHYIISSGIKEMIEGSPIANKFKKIYACSFIYDQNDVAVWPAVAVNYTTKTQFIFRINKGIEDDNDHETINKFIPREERAIPFSRMIYLGDGSTDVPCMRLIKDLGGTSIAVYPPRSSKKHSAAEHLLNDGRVNFISQADYAAGARLHELVKIIMEKIAADSKYLSFSSAKIQSRSKDEHEEKLQESNDVAKGLEGKKNGA